MDSFFQTLAFTYLLYPILGLLLVGLGIFIAKKNALLGNKRLVGYTIGAIVLLTLPALLGFLDYGFMPYGYIFLAMLYLLLGSYNIRMIAWVYKDDYKYRHEIILTGFILVVSMLFFTLVFNLCNELKYGLWASTCLLPHSSLSRYLSAPTVSLSPFRFPCMKYGDIQTIPGGNRLFDERKSIKAELEKWEE